MVHVESGITVHCRAEQEQKKERRKLLKIISCWADEDAMVNVCNGTCHDMQPLALWSLNSNGINIRRNRRIIGGVRPLDAEASLMKYNLLFEMEEDKIQQSTLLNSLALLLRSGQKSIGANASAHLPWKWMLCFSSLFLCFVDVQHSALIPFLAYLIHPFDFWLRDVFFFLLLFAINYDFICFYWNASERAALPSIWSDL